MLGRDEHIFIGYNVHLQQNWHPYYDIIIVKTCVNDQLTQSYTILRFVNTARENQNGKEEWTIQRHCQHWTHNTQKEGKTKRMSSTDIQQRQNQMLANGKQFLFQHSLISEWIKITCGCSLSILRQIISR